MGRKSNRWHLESGVDTMMVVVMDLMMDGLKELTHTIKAVHVAKFILKTTIKGFW